MPKRLKPYWITNSERPKQSFSKNTKFYNSKAWRGLSKVYRQRHPLCEICLKEGRKTMAVHTDHIKPYKDYPELGLRWDNLQSLCLKCHNNKSSKEK